MLTAKGRSLAWGLLAALFVVSVAMVTDLRPKHEEYIRMYAPVTTDERIAENDAGAWKDTPFSALLPVMLGFREVLASLMWVQADDLFHRGEYQPIMRLVKQISMIDPHNLDVYATGAWHMAYNFMDRRLVSDGVDFLRRGVRNNPHVYDLFFELGYMHYDKSKEYPEAARWYGEARNKPTTTGKPRAPMYVYSAYAHALERQGLIDDALKAWQSAYDLSEHDAKNERDDYAAKAAMATTRHNLYMHQRRINEREAAWAEWKGDRNTALGLWQKNVQLAKDYLAVEPGRKAVRESDLPVAEGNVARLQRGEMRRGGPKDLKFDYTWKRLGPRHLLIEGKMDMTGLARVSVDFRDPNYDELANRKDVSDDARVIYKMENATLQQDHTVQVRDGKFRYELKLDKDPADMGRKPEQIFPLKSDEYVLDVYFNPRQQAADVQDRFGWNGEGLTDSRYLVTDPSRTGVVNGQQRPLRFIRKRVIIKRSDIV